MRSHPHHNRLRPRPMAKRGDQRPPVRPGYPPRLPSGRATVPLKGLEIGVMETEDCFLALHSWEQCDQSSSSLSMTVDVERRWIDLLFGMGQQSVTLPNEAYREYKISVRSGQVHKLRRLTTNDAAKVKFLMTLEAPPFLFQAVDSQISLIPNAMTSNDSETWIRKCNVTDTVSYSPLSLRDSKVSIDVGRWLAYTFELSTESDQYDHLIKFMQQVSSDNFPLNSQVPIKIKKGSVRDLLGRTSSINRQGTEPSNDLHQLVDPAGALNFETRYQLEVCLSQGVIHDCNITETFILQLADEQNATLSNSRYESRAVRLLEAAAEANTRLYNPMDLFDLVPRAKKPDIPKYCAMVPAAVVTPTTIYFATPVLETSNRVIRRYQQHENRFMRVRFTDERYYGRINAVGELEKPHEREEIFKRIRQVMTHGILIGDRHYEFLAFGNSQFREHGAYFFASTSTVTAETIRWWMGDIGHIRSIAKYASRLGLCLTTTRTMSLAVTIEKIPDVIRNGHTFSDGVGKVSRFLAQMMADEMGLSYCPSVFQFRLGGYKGVLAVDPDLRGQIVQLRPSQEKFPARSHGLEVCRVSRYTSASLNMQLILVLSTLGVEDSVFIGKMRQSLQELETAMTVESMAISKLSRNVDFNGMTLVLVKMIQDGFMLARDPFLLSCLRLWRSWSVKLLKEKAHLYIEKGAFVLGCLDETGKLQGHSEQNRDPANHDKSLLPEIFLQISSDPSTGREYKALEGVCILARNPSLHPGDIRIVRAVDVPELHHLRDCVVLPQTGDRDLASMCSGGDLDGDDYLVMWDETILPKQWNCPAMSMAAGATTRSNQTENDTVSVNEMISFFVTHMKTDNLGRIAVAHRYWADWNQGGVNSRQCLELARLHSIAVDYAKTGIPATMPKYLSVQQWPHWCNPRNKPKAKIYHSKKILGKLYDEVERVPFEPVSNQNFDVRVLNAFPVDDTLDQAAREIKVQYDEALSTTMARYGIQTEFEAWTTFALEHTIEGSSYKFSEKFGSVMTSLKQQFQDLCLERAGTTRPAWEWPKLAPFVAAMYRVTSEEAATHESLNRSCFISFPWLFHRELGKIATQSNRQNAAPQNTTAPQVPIPKLKPHYEHKSPIIAIKEMDDIVVAEGEILDMCSDASAPEEAVSEKSSDTDDEDPSIPAELQRKSLRDLRARLDRLIAK